MTFWRLRPGRNRRGRRRSAEQDASARAVRARDHLARKREQERKRLERDRAKEDISAGRQRVLRIATPLGLAIAVALGIMLARPVSEWLWLGAHPLERIAVHGARDLEPKRVAAVVGDLVGQPLSHLSPQVLIEAFQRDPWIRDARVLRLPEGVLVVQVEERGAIARWQGLEQMELVDPAGIRFAGSLDAGGALPTIEGNASERAALPIEALQILAALRAHARFRDDPASVRLHLPRMEGPPERLAAPGDPEPNEADGYVLEFDADGRRALLGRRDLTQRVARLALLLNEETEASRAARWIDLRYADRAVLSTGNRSTPG